MTEPLTPFRPLEHLTSDEVLEEYVQERIRMAVEQARAASNEAQRANFEAYARKQHWGLIRAEDGSYEDPLTHFAWWGWVARDFVEEHPEYLG